MSESRSVRWVCTLFGSLHTIKAQCSHPVAKSSWAHLPLTSSLLGLPVCRLGAKPQNLGGQESNRGSDLPHLAAFKSLPTLSHLHLLPQQRRNPAQQPGGPLLFLALCSTGIQPALHSFCLSQSYPFLKVNAWHDIFLQTFLPASWEWLLAPLWSIVLCISLSTYGLNS